MPTRAVLEVREAGQDLIVDSDALRRAAQTLPRYGVTVLRVQHPMRLVIKRLRPRLAVGAVELIARCDPLTDELLGFEQSELGVVTVARVFDRFAYTSALADIKAGDIVRLR